MKQLLQDLRSGRVDLAEVPRPVVRARHLLIATARTLISTGTERMLVEFGKAGWIDKARRQPDKVRQALRKVRTDGRANGCRVIGIDIASSREETARLCGASMFVDSSAEDPVAAAMAATGGRGVDGVLITAATRSSDPVTQAAKMCRKRGRIVLVGVSGLELSRAGFYEKELSLRVSCSYGPGRYDPEYEEKGYDYPFGLVRWTEQRNFEAALDLMASGRLDVRHMIGRSVPLEQAPAVYEDLSGEGARPGILIEYAGISAADAVPVPTFVSALEIRFEASKA